MSADRNPFAKYDSDISQQLPSENNPFAKYHSDSVDNSLMDQIGNYAGKFNQAIESSRLPAFAGGLLQGAGDIGASLANVPLELADKISGKNIKVPHPNLGQYLPSDLATQASFGAGELATPMGGFGKLAGLTGKSLNATENISKIPLIGRLIAKPLEGAATGAAIGEDKEGNRGLGAIAGAAGNTALTLKDMMSSSKLAQGILNAKNSAKQKYSGLYEGLFNEANQKGLGDTPLRVPKIDSSLIKDNAADKYTKSLEDFNNNPTLENAHWAQSDMGKLDDYYSKMYNRAGLTSPQIKAWKEVQDAQKKIRGSMFSGLTKNGSQDLANEYGKLTQGYKQEVVPYLKSKPISDLESNEITHKEFLNKKFKPSLKALHPELDRAQMINKFIKMIPVKSIIGGAAGAAGIGAGYNAYNDWK